MDEDAPPAMKIMIRKLKLYLLWKGGLAETGKDHITLGKNT